MEEEQSFGMNLLGFIEHLNDVREYFYDLSLILD